MSYAHILGTMYELSSYYDNGFIIDELCYIISSIAFIMTPTKYPEVPQSTHKYLKVPRSTSKFPEVPQSTQKYLKLPRSTSKYPEVPQSTSKYLEVPRSTSK